MPAALKQTSDPALHLVRSALTDAADDVAAAADILMLLCLAGTGMGKDQGDAIARGAMMALDHLEAVRAWIQQARNEIEPLNHTAASG